MSQITVQICVEKYKAKFIEGTNFPWRQIFYYDNFLTSVCIDIVEN